MTEPVDSSGDRRRRRPRAGRATVVQALESRGFTFAWQDEWSGTAEKGSKGKQVLLGGFAPHLQVGISLHAIDRGTVVRLVRPSSGICGGLMGRAKAVKQFNGVADELLAAFREAGVLLDGRLVARGGRLDRVPPPADAGRTARSCWHRTTRPGPLTFEVQAARIRTALGAVATEVEHVGSTSVPGLAAKPIIDINLLVVDSADESAYVPALEALGYVLHLREPGWHEHRLAAPRRPARSTCTCSRPARPSMRA